MSSMIRVLLVENTLIDQKVFKHYVQRAGASYDIAFVASLDDARAALAARPFDIVLIDIRAGAAAFDFVIEISPTPSILIASKDEDEDMIAQAMDLGVLNLLSTDREGRNLPLLPAMIGQTLRFSRTEAELAHYRQDLEHLVEKRTEELTVANQILQSTILELNQVSESLRTSEERLRRAVNISNVGFFEDNHLTNEVYISPILRKIYGWTEDETINIEQIVSHIHPNERERIAQTIDAAHDPSGDGMFDVEHRIFRRDGDVRWVAVRSKTIFEGVGQARHPVRTQGAVIDITARKSAEQRLQMFQYTTEQASDAIFWLNRDAKFIYVNEQACRSLGYTREELLALELWDVDPVYRLEQWEEVWENYHAAHIDLRQNIETVHRRKDGSSFPVQVSTSQIYFGDQELQVAVVRDITARKRTENLIRALNAAALAMHKATTPAQTFAAVSEELRKVDLSCTIFSLDDTRSRLVMAHYTLPDQNIQTLEQFTGLKAENVLVPVPPTGVIHDCIEHGKPAFLASVNDIVRQVLPAHVSLTADKILNMLGITKAIMTPLIVEDQVIGSFSVFADHLQEDDISTIMAFSHQVAAAWRQSQLFAQAQTELTARRLAEAKVVQLNEELEQRVAERTEQLEAANAELSNFAYVASHDLKAPLRAISQLSSWIIEDYANVLDEDGRSKLNLLIDRTRHMHNLIDGILEYSRIGRLPEKTRRIDLNVLVQEVVNVLAPPPSIQIEVEGSLPVVFVDETYATQVFQNLLHNAIQYMDKAAGSIHIAHSEAQDEWLFSVADNGPGIDQKYHAKIFQMFQTLGTRKDIDSTGIGLAVVKRIIEKWDGKIWVESTLGTGTTFFFTIPKPRSER